MRFGVFILLNGEDAFMVYAQVTLADDTADACSPKKIDVNIFPPNIVEVFNLARECSEKCIDTL